MDRRSTGLAKSGKNREKTSALHLPCSILDATEKCSGDNFNFSSKYCSGSKYTNNTAYYNDTRSMGNIINRTSSNSRRNSPMMQRKVSSSNSASSRQSQVEHFANKNRLPLKHTAGYIDSDRKTAHFDKVLATSNRRSSTDSGYNSCEKVFDSTTSDTSRQYSLYQTSCTGRKNDNKFDVKALHDGVINLDKRNNNNSRLCKSYTTSTSRESSELFRIESARDRERFPETLGRITMNNDSKTSSYVGDRSMRSRSPKISTSGLAGLQNLGNTCLSHCKPLRDKLISHGSLHHNTQSRMKGKLISAFADLINAMWSGNKTGIAVSPLSFKQQIQKFAPRFVGYEQQDSQEFLRFLLDGLHEDLNRVSCRRSSRGSPDTSKLSEEDLSEYMWRQYKSRDDSLVTDLFCGQMMSTLTCTKCNHRSVTFDPFWDLSLPIPRRPYSYSSSRFSNPSVTLIDCLKLFTKKEDLDGDEKPKCDKCKMRQKCQKQFKIQKFPRILVLHLKRFSGFGFRSKLQIDVEFPLNNLNMSEFASRQSDFRSVRYNLFAVSNHSGSTYGGHYTAYCKHPESKEWHSFNDSRVGALASSSVHGSQAYVLFYEIEDVPNSGL